MDNRLKVIDILLALICLLIPAVLSCWSSASTRLGVSTPDPTFVVGNQMEVNCTLSNTTIEYMNRIYEVNSSMISFKFNSTYYPKEKVTLVNATEAQLVVRRASVEDNGMYYCLLNISGLDHNPLVCVTRVTVGYEPQPVKDFKCISLHYHRLICSWTPQRNPIKTKYSLVHRTIPNSKSSYFDRKCGVVPRDNVCEWNMDTDPPYRKNSAQKLHFILYGENELGVFNQSYIMNPYSIIKPKEPQDLRYADVKTDQISITWRPPAYIDIDEEVRDRIIYEIRLIRIEPFDTHRTSKTVVNHPLIIDGIHKNTSYSLTQLIPFTNYNISIRCKTIDAMSDEYWSDYVWINVTTEADVPYDAPLLIPESFEAVKNTEGNRSITLYWKPLPHQYLNGPDFYYSIVYFPTSKRKLRSINNLYNSINIRNSSTTHYTFAHMDTKTAYLFKIYGANVKGISKNYSEITVYKSEHIPHKPTDIDVFSYGAGRYELHWKRPRDGTFSIVSYTVFWCPNLRPRPFPCEGAIDWLRTTNMTIPLELPDITTNYQFAVSANTIEASSGMTWASCVVPIDGKPDKISDVRLEVLSSTSVKVHWKLECPAQKRLIEQYRISYCKMSSTLYSKKCTDSMNYETINDNLADNFNLTNLEPFRQYRISMVAMTDLGPTEASDPKFVTTFPDTPDDGPSNLKLTDVTTNSISLNWRPPNKPNGKLSYYEVVSNGRIFKKSVTQCSEECKYNITSLSGYEDYEVKVKACVNPSLCSPFTTIRVKTREGIPSQMHPPRTEVINATTVRISWAPPIIKNGPIDYYLLKLEWSNNKTEPSVYNISAKYKYYYLTLDCNSHADDSSLSQRYAVKILAVNKRGDEVLMGNYSDSTYTNACLGSDSSDAYLVGAIAGGAIGLTCLVAVLYMLVRWMKKKIKEAKVEFKIQLPMGLDAPQIVTDNPKLVVEFNNTTDKDCFKDRHGSGTSHTSSSSTEGLIYRNTNDGSFSRQVSSENGHGSLSSHSSNGDAHISSDSGVEADTLKCKDLTQLTVNLPSKAQMPIVDESVLRNSDSSGSKDSGLDMNSSGIQEKTKRRRRRSIRTSPLPTKVDVKNPLYDSPLNTFCAYNLLANSEPSITDLPLKEDENFLNDFSKFYKPEIAKSLSSIIQNPYSKNDYYNTTSISSTRTASPVYPYSKFGVRRMIPIKNNYTFVDINSTTPRKTAAKSDYVTIDSILKQNECEPSRSTHKTRMECTKEWSQNSYDAEVSSTSSNGDNNEQTDVLPNSYENSSNFNVCEKIQNDSLVNIFHNSSVFDSDINSFNESPLTDSYSDYTDSTEVQFDESSTPVTSNDPNVPHIKFVPNSNGYVSHEVLNQNNASNDSDIQSKVVKKSNGYVVIPEIEMKNVSMPNNVFANHMTQV